MNGSRGTNNIFGADPLDSQLPPVRAARRPRGSWWLRNRLALGLSATPVPGVLLVIGLVLGPDGLNLISRSVLSALDPAVSAALAALGLLVGLDLDLRRRRERLLLGAASLEAGLTIVLVGGGVFLTLARSPVDGVSPWLLAAILGVCAAASSTSPMASPLVLGSSSSRVADLDDVLPILAGGALLGLVRAPSATGTVWLTVASVGLAAAIACAGWLLLARASSASEHYVYTAGLVLLLGGLAEFLGLSALFFGLVGGLFLSTVGGGARERMAEGVRHVQHPLLVLLLLVAGARVVFKPVVFPLVLVYIALRLAGKIGGGAFLRRVWVALPEQFWRTLISPGVVAAAFALNVGQAGADPSGVILAAAVAGAIFTEIVALFASPKETAS